MRDVAGLNRVGFAATAALLLVAALPGPAGGADPSPAPGGVASTAPTCAERFPTEGPAGVDLRLGCIVSEVIGLWRPDQTTPPPTLSTYAIWLVVLIVAGVGLGLVGVRLLGRRAGQRLAATTPEAWWVCSACHSVNALASPRCYNCSAARPDDADATPMLTSDRPSTPQSFGRGKHA